MLEVVTHEVHVEVDHALDPLRHLRETLGELRGKHVRATVDWVNRLSSLNDAQAHIDDDGWFRAVVSKQDPRVYNWLDKADFPWGVLQARFYRANEYPEATVTRVPRARVLDHLPSDTRTVTPEEREEQLRLRRTGAQLRRIW